MGPDLEIAVAVGQEDTVTERDARPGRGDVRLIGWAGIRDLDEQLRLGIDLLRNLGSVGSVKLPDQPIG